MRKRIFLFLAVFVALVGSVVLWYSYSLLWQSNFTGDDAEVFVDENTSYTEIYNQLKINLKDPLTFDHWAKVKELPENLKAGRYVFEDGLTNRQMVNMLLAGLQTPVRVRFHNVENFPDLAGQLAGFLQADSLDFLAALNNDSLWSSRNVEEPRRLAYVVPNTYEFYWDTAPLKVVDRLIAERDKFWNESRLEKAEELGLTPEEVVTLASIVQKETYMADERPKVAGLYLNRLNRGILLQSDPTVKYAYERAHPGLAPIRRVLYVMLEWDSPYNTYIYKGLPPGPISIVEVQSIDAVLDPDSHDYIFMCADPDNPGYHAFAKTNRQHNINKQRYIAWLEG